MLDLAGLTLLPNQHCDGVCLKPVPNGDNEFSRGTIFWHLPHYFNNGGQVFLQLSMDIGNTSIIVSLKRKNFIIFEDIGEESSLEKKYWEISKGM